MPSWVVERVDVTLVTNVVAEVDVVVRVKEKVDVRLVVRVVEKYDAVVPVVENMDVGRWGR
jgi:hypothetical protein